MFTPRSSCPSASIPLVLGALALPALSGCGAPSPTPDEIKAALRQEFRAEFVSKSELGKGDRILEELQQQSAELRIQRDLFMALYLSATSEAARPKALFADASFQLQTPLRLSADIKGNMKRSMKDPTLRLEGKDSLGAGTVVYCEQDKAGEKLEHVVLVLTARHVVRNILGDSSGAEGISGFINPGKGKSQYLLLHEICRDTDYDVSLLIGRSQDWISTAKFVAPNQASGIEELDAVGLYGCPLGLDPVLTFGHISSLDSPIAAGRYILTTADAYFGNSGGGAYCIDPSGEGRLFGVLSKVNVARERDSRDRPVAGGEFGVVPHLSYATRHQELVKLAGKVGCKIDSEGAFVVADRELFSTAVAAIIRK